MGEEVYTVTIDVDAVRARLPWAYGRPATRDNAVSWLKRAGFTETRWPGVYIGTKDAVAALRENEVVAARPFGA